jgi:hypothetical protein
MSKLELKLSDVLILVLHGFFSVVLFIAIFQHLNPSLTTLAPNLQKLTSIAMRSYKDKTRLDEN